MKLSIRRGALVVCLGLSELAGGCGGSQRQAQEPPTANSPATESSARDPRDTESEELMNRIWDVAKGMAPAEPTQPACQDLRPLATKACELGIDYCAQSQEKCSTGASLCGLGISAMFRRCTSDYSVADRDADPVRVNRELEMPVIDSKVVHVFEFGCAQGTANDCAFLGWLYDRGIGVPRDGQRRVKLLTEACSKGSGDGCYELGMVYLLGKDAPLDLARAAQIFEQACHSNGSACRAFASAHVDGKGVARDVPRALEILAQSCTAGDRESCREQECLKNLPAESATVLKMLDCVREHWRGVE